MARLLGQIQLFPYDFAPNGWIFCDGREVPIDDYKNLFNQLEFTFGGGGDKFCMPDLREMTPPNCHYCIAAEGDDLSYYGPNGATFLRREYFMPSNLKYCDGQSLEKSKYSDLERLIGSRFGSGPNTFNLPDLRTKNPDNLNYMMSVLGYNPEFAQGYLGELYLLPFELSRTDFIVLCDGRHLYRQRSTELFSLLGTRFGGNESEFYLPDLRSSTPSQFNYYISLQGIYPQKV
jgi:microcystin-dependent protein